MTTLEEPNSVREGDIIKIVTGYEGKKGDACAKLKPSGFVIIVLGGKVGYKYLIKIKKVLNKFAIGVIVKEYGNVIKETPSGHSNDISA